MWTYDKHFAAHLGETGWIVTIPDQIADDQLHHARFDTIFPARDDRGNILMVKLDAGASGLHMLGTGDPVVREVE